MSRDLYNGILTSAIVGQLRPSNKKDCYMSTNETRTPTVSAESEGSILTLTFSNGVVRVIDYNQLSPDIQLAAAVHGLKQKLVDAAAIARNPDTGRSATVGDKVAAVDEVFDRITSPYGTWNKIRGDGAVGQGGLLLRAIMQLSGKDKASVVATLDSMTPEEKMALRNMPKIAAIIAGMKAATTKIDTEALLEQFGV